MICFFRIDFPFIVLLISGGHCLLALVKEVDDFYLLGKSLDDAPGDAFDKVTNPFNSPSDFFAYMFIMFILWLLNDFIFKDSQTVTSE